MEGARSVILPVIFVVVSSIICVFLIIKKNRRLPPGPWNIPTLGYLPWLDSKMPHLSFTKLAKKYGPIYGLNLGTVYTVVISDAKILKKILMKDEALGKAPLFILEKATRGKGLICTEGDRWKNQRKFVVKFLRNAGVHKISTNRKILEDKILKCSSDFLKYLSDQGDQVVLEPLEELLHMIGSIVTYLTIGKSLSRNDKIWRKILQLMKEGEAIVAVGGPLNFLPFLRILPKFKNILRFIHESYKTIKSVYVPIIERCSLQNDGSKSNLIQAFLEEQKLHNSNEIYNTEQLFILLNEIFAAALDTTINATYWFVLYMAVHQEVQKKLRHQLTEVLEDVPFRMKYISKLPYLEATIAEVMRIRVVEPSGVPHGCMEEFEVEGFRIPKGTMIIPLLWAIHMDPKVWRDPEVFKPERFLSHEEKFSKPEEFIPFQTGKRICVGEELGKMIIYTFAATVLRKFKIELKDPSKVDLTGVCLLILSPKPHDFIFTKIC